MDFLNHLSFFNNMFVKDYENRIFVSLKFYPRNLRKSNTWLYILSDVNWKWMRKNCIKKNWLPKFIKNIIWDWYLFVIFYLFFNILTKRLSCFYYASGESKSFKNPGWCWLLTSTKWLCSKIHLVQYA